MDPVEDWLLRKLREMQLDDWVVEGLASSAMVIEDKDDVLLTLQNFLGKDDHGTLRALVDELFCLRERYHKKDETPHLGGMNADRLVETSNSAKTPSRQTGESEPIRLQDLDRQVLNCLGCGKIFRLTRCEWDRERDRACFSPQEGYLLFLWCDRSIEILWCRGKRRT